MATTAVKQNGTSKNEVTAKTSVVKKLAQDAVKSAPAKVQKQVPKTPEPTLNLDERINRFEKLKGIATNRERLVGTLSNLTRFNYNSSESCTFYLRDASGLEFKTTNSTLINLIAEQLQQTLEERKSQLEKQLMEFQL